MISPVEKPVCTSGYGWRTVFKKPNFHPGTDLVSRSGNRTVYSPIAGVVVSDFDLYNHALRWKDRRHSAGNFIAIEFHFESRRLWLRFIHLESNRVGAQQQIKAGQPVGNYGKVGMSTGPHLHLDLWDPAMRKFADPRPFFDAFGIPYKKGVAVG